MKPVLLIKQSTQTTFHRIDKSSVEEQVADLVKIASENKRELTISHAMVPAHVADGLAPQSGVKAFDALVARTQGVIMTGNVWSSAQFSNYVRSESRLEANGTKFLAGRLADSDVQSFGKERASMVKGFVKSARMSHPHLRDSDLIVYLFRGPRIDYGYLITDAHMNLVGRHLLAQNGNPILDEAERFVSKSAVTESFDLARSGKDASGAWRIEILTPGLQNKIDAINRRHDVADESQAAQTGPRPATPRG